MVFLQIFPITADSNFESVHSMVPRIIQRHVREGFNKKSWLLVRLFKVLTKFGDDKHNRNKNQIVENYTPTKKYMKFSLIYL